jgi:hypothetical protein
MAAVEHRLGSGRGRDCYAGRVSAFWAKDSIEGCCIHAFECPKRKTNHLEYGLVPVLSSCLHQPLHEPRHHCRVVLPQQIHNLPQHVVRKQCTDQFG